MDKSRLASLVVACLVASPALAQRVYKCDDGRGGNTYQETPCATDRATKSVRAYQRVPDAPRDYGQYGGIEYAAPVPPSTTPAAAGGGGWPDEERRRCENLAALSDKTMFRALCMPRTAQARSAPPPPVHREPEGPRRIQDQHGNWYTQPPGSSFVTDERTGKQCFTFGNVVKCD